MMEQIGRYEILEELGRGAMGAVYKARDPQIGRTVAIKVILTANLSSEDLQNYKQRFYREAQAAGQMSHSGIVTIHDIAEDASGQPYLVMEYVEGTTLDKLLAPTKSGLAPERLPLSQVLEIAIQVAEALDYAHRRGVIHRDIKPANILITAEGSAKIADFGIAKLAGTQLTQTGQLVGTPAFMSPEQFSGAAVDSRSDIFSLGAMLYWMCTGEKPFAGDTLTAVSFKVVYSSAIPARQLNPALPAEIDLVLSRCLAKNPDERYATGRELAADLEALKAGHPVAARPVPTAAVEKTIVQAVAVPAVPAPRHVGEPAPVAVQRTVLLTPPVVSPPWRAEPQPAAPLGILDLPRFVAGLSRLAGTLPRVAKTRPKLSAAVAAAAVAFLMLVGYWLWPGKQPESSTPATAGSSAPRPKPAPAAPKPVSMSTLRVECLHNFAAASLEIFADDKPLLETALRGEVETVGPLKIARGTLRTSKPIPAGSRLLRVRVSAPREGYEEEQEISGTFRQGGSRTLAIEFGRGSGVGIVERKLTLHWR